MARSNLAKSLVENQKLLTKSRHDTLPLKEEEYTYEKSDCPLQTAFSFFPEIWKHKEAPAKLKTFLYGDSSLHGSGYWNNLLRRTQPVVEAILAAETHLFEHIPGCITDLQGFVIQDGSFVEPKRVDDAIKKALRSCMSASASQGSVPAALASINECTGPLKAELNHQIFTDWARAYERFYFYGHWLREHQDLINRVYQKFPSSFSTNRYYGFPPFGSGPRAMHYQLKEPDGFKKYYSTPELFTSDMRATARNLPVTQNTFKYNQYNMGEVIAGRKNLDIFRNTWVCHQYMVSQEMQRVDIANTSALDLTVRLRGSRRIGRNILRAFETWQSLYAELLQPSLAQLELALQKLSGNLFSADTEEIELNWAELTQACLDYTAAATKFTNTSGYMHEELFNAGDVEYFENLADDPSNGVEMDKEFMQIMGEQLDEKKELAE